LLEALEILVEKALVFDRHIGSGKREPERVRMCRGVPVSGIE
jgi:hypothetical protein